MAKNLWKEIKKETLIGAVAVIVLGILLLLGVEDLLFTILGIALLVFGAAYLILYIVNLVRGTRASYQILLASAMFVFGVIFFYQNGLITSLLTTIIAAVLVIDGATKLDDSIGMLKGKRSGAGIVALLFSVVAIVLGILILFGVISAMDFIAYILIADGVLDIITLILIGAKKR